MKLKCFKIPLQVIKKHFNRLVKKAVVLNKRTYLRTVFGKAFQPKQSRCIAFVDGNFHITGTVEQHQLFTLWYIGIRSADALNYFIALEHNFKTTSFTLLLKLLLRNVHHYIFKIVDK